LLSLCYGAVPLGFIKRYFWQHSATGLHLLGRLLYLAIPGISIDTDPQMRVFETFQWYREKHQWHRTFEELRDLMRAEGLHGVKQLKSPHIAATDFPDVFVSVVARRAPF
jgi:hypothetical protein